MASQNVRALRQTGAPGFAQVPGQLVEDPTLSCYAFRVLALIRLHDYGRGGGCFLSRREMARRGGMSEATVKRALRELRAAGLITTALSTDGRTSNVHFWAHEGGPADPTGVTQTPIGGSQRTQRGSRGPRGGGHTDPEGGSHRVVRGGHTEPPLYKDEVDDKEVDDGEVKDREVEGTAAAAAGPPPPPGPDPGETHEGTEDGSGGGDGDGVTPYRVAAALLEAQGRPARRETVLPLVAAARELVVEPYAGRVTMEQIRGCLAEMAQRPFFARALHRLTSVRLATDLGPWLMASAPTPPQRWCECGVALDEGKMHTLHCKLWGPVTQLCYVDAREKMVIWPEDEPWRVRERYRAAVGLTPEQQEQGAEQLLGAPGHPAAEVG